jgi:hypothetical protein
MLLAYCNCGASYNIAVIEWSDIHWQMVLDLLAATAQIATLYKISTPALKCQRPG